MRNKRILIGLAVLFILAILSVYLWGGEEERGTVQETVSESGEEVVGSNLHFFEDPAIKLAQVRVNVFFFSPKNLNYRGVLENYYRDVGRTVYRGDVGVNPDVSYLKDRFSSAVVPRMTEFHKREFGAGLGLDFVIYPEVIYGLEEDRYYQSDFAEVPPREVLNKVESELRTRVFVKTGDLYDPTFVESGGDEYAVNLIVYLGPPLIHEDFRGQALFVPAFTNYSKSTFLVVSPVLESGLTYDPASIIYHEFLHTLGVPEQYNQFSLDFFSERNERTDVMGRGADLPLLQTYIGEDIKRKMGALPGGFASVADEKDLLINLSPEAKNFFRRSIEIRREYPDSSPFKIFVRDRDRDGLIDVMDTGGYLHLTPRWSASQVGSVPGVPSVFYRYVRDCPTRETIERQIIDTSYGYANYGGADRYEEQCINDGSFDAYYVESLTPLEGAPASQPSIRVVYPNGGESLRIGDIYHVTYRFTGFREEYRNQAVQIQLWDAVENTIVGTVCVVCILNESGGAYTWDVGSVLGFSGPGNFIQVPPGQYKIRVSVVGLATSTLSYYPEDFSDAPFSIISVSP